MVGVERAIPGTILVLVRAVSSGADKGVPPRRGRPRPGGPMAEPPASRRLDGCTAVKTQLAVETIAKREAQMKEAAEREARAAMVAGKAPGPKTTTP